MARGSRRITDEARADPNGGGTEDRPWVESSGFSSGSYRLVGESCVPVGKHRVDRVGWWTAAPSFEVPNRNKRPGKVSEVGTRAGAWSCPGWWCTERDAA
ncbi:hypothetical protein Franean1_1372 [Parafrankia sp. EAN1pec]|nr:hypothetical protein Franean1_1372 [Frankia sp. EAN1pec]